MKGTLHKTGSGWQVWYHAKEDLFYGNTGVRILPLHPDDTIGIGQEELSVDFEIVSNQGEPLGRGEQPYKQYAKLIDQRPTTMKGGEGWDKILDKAIQDKATRPLTEDDAWRTMKEGDITVNFKPMPEFDDPKYPDYPTRTQQLHIQIAEECFRKYPNNEVLYPTDELKDAYKAGVIDGLKEWTLDSYDRPKYPEVKIICPRCKALMPCECNPPRQTSLLDSVRANPSWDTIIREFQVATQQVPKGAPPLIFECWLVENYNPPTKKQDNE